MPKILEKSNIFSIILIILEYSKFSCVLNYDLLLELIRGDKMTFLEEVGNRVKNQRNSLGITQQELTNKVSVNIEITDKQISCLERGISGTGLEKFTALSLALDKTPDYFLLGLSRDGHNKSELIRMINEYLLLCDYEELDSLVTISRTFALKK